MRPPFTTVVVCFNEGTHLERTVENLRVTSPADTEIVIVDDGSTDGSTAFAERATGRLRLVRTSRLGVAKARN